MADLHDNSDYSSALTCDEEDSVYLPKTEETRAAYMTLLSIILQQFGGEHPSTKYIGAADEILAILKHDIVKISDKKKEIEVILNPIPNHIFDEIVSIGNLITDFDTTTCYSSGTFSRKFGKIRELEDSVHNQMMDRARELGIEAEMEKLPPLHTLPRSLLRFVNRVRKERVGIINRNVKRIARASGMDAKKIENLQQQFPLFP